jgi:hypothetical protein
MKDVVEQGTRLNAGKLRWSLMSKKALEPMIEVLMFGAEKYDDHNWKKGLPITEIIDSLQRHIVSFQEEGHDKDAESGLDHVGHILCNAMFLSYMYQFRKDMDDRFHDKNLNNE